MMDRLRHALRQVNKEPIMYIFKVNNFRKVFLKLFLVLTMVLGLFMLLIVIHQAYYRGIQRDSFLIAGLGVFFIVGGVYNIKLLLKFITNIYTIDCDTIVVTTFKKKIFLSR